jgi:hypothetical protein
MLTVQVVLCFSLPIFFLDEIFKLIQRRMYEVTERSAYIIDKQIVDQQPRKALNSQF